MEEMCKDFNQYDEDSLLETEEDGSKYKKAVKKTYKQHYGKTKRAIDKENRHILTT